MSGQGNITPGKRPCDRGSMLLPGCNPVLIPRPVKLKYIFQFGSPFTKFIFASKRDRCLKEDAHGFKNNSPAVHILL